MNEFGEKFPLLKAAVEFLMRTNPEDEDTLDNFTSSLSRLYPMNPRVRSET